MTALRAVVGTTVLTISLLAGVVSGVAGADPGDYGSGYAQCGSQLVPADPRVDMQNPLGAVIYRWWLTQLCPPPPPVGHLPTGIAVR